MLKWETVFKELDIELDKVKSRYKPTSQINIIIMMSNHKSERWRVPFEKVKEQIWRISSEYPHAVVVSVRTIRNKILYEVTRYPLVTGQGAGAQGDETTIEKFSNLGEVGRNLLVRLLHSQIQDRFVMEDAINEQSK